MNEYPHLSQALGKTIERFRKNRKMTKSALAEFAWLERHYLREIELGVKKPSLNAVYSICRALRVAPSEFFQALEAERQKLEARAKRDA